MIKGFWMKKYLFLASAILMTTAQQAFCEVQKANPQLSVALKDTSHEPNAWSIIFALLFVIFLIYVTGLIYSKLNMVGAKTVKDQLKSYNLDRAVVLSTTQLGQGKNLHVIEINNKQFLIGATQHSISLLKELESAKTEEKYPQVEKPKETSISEESAEIEKEIQDKFDVHKKYL